MRADKGRLLRISLCILCFAVIVVGTQKYGPGVTHDSVAYLYTADHFARGEGMPYFGYTSPFVQWPPLFAALLAPFGQEGAVEASRWFNALFMALALFITGETLQRKLNHGVVPVVFTGMALLSFPLVKMAFFVWSEPLFLLLTAGVFHLLFTTDWKRGRFAPIFWMAVLSALACLTRYVGVVPVASVCIFLLLALPGWKKKWGYTFLYGLISVVPTLVFLVRNVILSDTLVGMRSPSGISMLTNTWRALKTVLAWLIPPVMGKEGLLALVPALVFMGLMAVLFIGAVKEKERFSRVLFMASYGIFYSLYMIVSASRVAFDPIGDRYMIPVLLPLFFLLAELLDWALSYAETNKTLVSKAGLGLFALLLAGSLISNASLFLSSIRDSIEKGAGGFNADSWKEHEFLSYAGLFADSDMIYSNNPAAVQYLTGRESHYIPKKFGIPLYGYDAFYKESLGYEHQYIIWFGSEASTTVYTPSELSDSFKIEELAKGNSVVLYRMDKETLP